MGWCAKAFAWPLTNVKSTKVKRQQVVALLRADGKCLRFADNSGPEYKALLQMIGDLTKGP